MSSLQVRKAILRSRAVEFSRLLMLAMLENASDTFSAMLMVLGSELGKSNLSVDQFLKTYSELIDELRLKINTGEDNTPSNQKSNGIVVLDSGSISRKTNELQRSNHATSSNHSKVTPTGNQCNICKTMVDPNYKFYFSLGICQKCYTTGLENRRDNSINNEILPIQNLVKPVFTCKRCQKPLSESSGLRFNGHCSVCHQKAQRSHQKQSSASSSNKPANFSPHLGDRQCSECKKVVAKGRVFYRSAHLCKNCYERHRVLIRKTNKRQCLVCNKISSEDLLNDKCMQCYYQQTGQSSNINNEAQFEEHRMDSLNSTDKINSWIDSIEGIEQNAVINEDVEMLLNLCQSDFSHCSICKKSAEGLNESGVCGSCRQSAMSIKDESPN